MSLINARSTPDADFRATPQASAATAPVGHPSLAPRWVERRVGTWTWHFRADFESLLERGPDWLHLDSDPRATLVKSNDGRHVWRVQLHGQEVYVKVGRPARRWARLRRFWFGPDAVKEWRCAAYAAAFGIPAVEPVACAYAPVRGRGANSILITAGVPGARPLNEYWQEGRRGAMLRPEKAALIDAVAALIARAHAAGFEHYDLHAGNVLVAPGQRGEPRVLFVDLNNVRCGRTVDASGVARNLAQFNQWFRQHAPLTDRIRFLSRYLHWRDALAAAGKGPPVDCDRRRLVSLLDRAAVEHAGGLYAKRDRKALRSGKYFSRVSLPGGWRGHVFLESKHAVPGSRASELRFTIDEWRAWLKRPLEWVSPAERSRLIKDSASATVCRALLPTAPDPLEVVCKRATPRNLLKKAQNLFRSSRPMQTWKTASALLNRQIPTARPLAVLERRCCGMVVDSVLITEYIEHAHDLDTLLTVTMRDLPPARQRWLKREVMRSLATVTRRLLDRGFGHRDFKAPNIIVQWNQPTEQPPRVLLIDLDGVRRTRRRDRAEERMLMRLNVSLDHCRRVSRTDRLRFLLLCLRSMGHPQPDWKSMWRRLEGLSERKRTARSRSQEKKFRKHGRF